MFVAYEQHRVHWAATMTGLCRLHMLQGTVTVIAVLATTYFVMWLRRGLHLVTVAQARLSEAVQPPRRPT